ncbi:hypothetical protein QTN25_002755 [Entamoeba marina]
MPTQLADKIFNYALLALAISLFVATIAFFVLLPILGTVSTNSAEDILKETTTAMNDAITEALNELN